MKFLMKVFNYYIFSAFLFSVTSFAGTPSREAVEKLLISMMAVESMQKTLNNQVIIMQDRDPVTAAKVSKILAKIDKKFYMDCLIHVYSKELTDREVDNLSNLFSGDVGKKFVKLFIPYSPNFQADFYSKFTEQEQREILLRLEKVGHSTFQKASGSEFTDKISDYILLKVAEKMDKVNNL